MNKHSFFEANLHYQVIKKTEERSQFWLNLKDPKQKEIGSVALSTELSYKLDNLIDEIIEEHNMEIRRNYKFIEKL